MKIDKNVDPEVKRACKEFVAWLRTEYFFPKRVPIYIKSAARIKARDGELVYGTFLGPYDLDLEPYIRIATGDYASLVGLRGQDNALASILISISHELTHYFQWVNGLQLTAIGEERQAKSYAVIILDEYAETRDHP